MPRAREDDVEDDEKKLKSLMRHPTLIHDIRPTVQRREGVWVVMGVKGIGVKMTISQRLNFSG